LALFLARHERLAPARRPSAFTHVDTQSMYRSLTSSVLSADQPSQYSEHLLTRFGLGERFDAPPTR